MLPRPLLCLAVTSLLAVTTTCAEAGFKLTAGTVTGQGTYNNSLALLTDGVIPAEGTNWQSSSNVWWSGQTGTTGVTFTFDYGAIYSVEDVRFSFDNNDAYRIDYSTDNSTWSYLAHVAIADGEINPIPGGMDTGTGIAGDVEYIANLDFSAVNARYLRIYATAGDTAYSLGEFEAYGSNLSAVPEPSSLALFILAGVIGAALRRRRV